MGVERVGDNLQSIGLSAADAADKLISAALDQTDVGPGWVALWITLAVALSILSWRYYVALPPEAMEGAATKSAAAAKEVKSELLRFWTRTDRFRCPGGAGSDASESAAKLDDRPATYDLTGTVTLRQLAGFVIPLSMTNIAVDVGEGFLVAGIGHLSSGATTTTTVLAGFALAFQLTTLVGGPLVEFKAVGMLLCSSVKSRRTVLRSLAVVYACVFAAMLLLANTAVGRVVIDEWHRTGPDIGGICRRSLFLLSLWPLCDGLALVHAGMLLRRQHAKVVSAASACDIAAQIVVVVVASLATAGGEELDSEDLLTLPVACAYAGVLTRLAVCYGGYLWYVVGDFPQNDPPPETQARIAPTLASDALDGSDKKAALPAYTTLVSVFAFAWPLALVNSAQKASRPLVNLAVSRSATGAGGIAVLTVCYPIVHALYGWLDELKSVFPAFCPIPRCHDPADKNAAQIRRLAQWMLGASIVLSAVVAYSPIGHWVICEVLGVGDDLAQRGRLPLRIFVLFALPVAFRAYSTGFITAAKRTELLATSSGARIAGVFAGCAVLQFATSDGATLGVLALLTGFSAEAAVASRAAWQLQQTLKRKGPGHDRVDLQAIPE